MATSYRTEYSNVWDGAGACPFVSTGQAWMSIRTNAPDWLNAIVVN
jgi:hypothetical protein